MQWIEWSLSASFAAVASAAPDRDMLVWKNVRRTYREVAARTRNLAAFFAQSGVGGEKVVGIVQLREGSAAEPDELREFVAGRVARFKAPRAIAYCERVHRHASGKGDYQWARSVAEQAVAVAATR